MQKSENVIKASGDRQRNMGLRRLKQTHKSIRTIGVFKTEIKDKTV